MRLNAEERRILGEKSSQAGVSISSLIRRAALDLKLKPRPARIDAEAMRELSAIGNNLNQLARALNQCGSTGTIDPVLLANLRRQLDTIQTAMLEVAKGVART